jgi:hypothetical protein
MTEAEQRARLISVGRTWLRTPFHDQQGLKGVGVDCAHLLSEVAAEAGVIEPVEIETYSPQFMLHSGDERFIGYVTRFAREIEEKDVKPADLVLYRVGRSFAHGAFVIEWPVTILHAFKAFRCVAETGAFEGDLHGRKTRFFSFW